MNIARHTDPNFEAQLRGLAASSSLFDPLIQERTEGILAQVARDGDGALVELTARFDGATLTPEQLLVTKAERVTAALVADEALRDAVRVSSRNIEAFSRKSMRKAWSARNAQGAKV